MTIENLIVYTYSKSVETAKELQNDLNCRRIASSSARAARRIPKGALVVNWGYGRVPDWATGQQLRYLNNPNQVRRKIAKVEQLRKFQAAAVPTVEFTIDRATATGWGTRGDRVLARRDGSYGGMGIVCIEAGDTKALSAQAADFYTRYFDKTHEFRFHIFRQRVIDVVQKKRLNDAKPAKDLTEQTVRNFANGWIEAHNNLHLPGDSRRIIADTACRAVEALGLDFGAVDIMCIFTGPGQSTLASLAVCEVNTAPGLGKVEREAYVNAIKNVYTEEFANV